MSHDETTPPTTTVAPAPADAPSADLLSIQQRIYDPCGFVSSALTREADDEYEAHRFVLDGRGVRFRSARKSPGKDGLVVSLTRPDSDGVMKPYDAGDSIDLFVIATRGDGHFGHFVFPAIVLRERRILSYRENVGKRSFRLYPPWSIPQTAQADRTRRWQKDFYLAMDEDQDVDLDVARALYV